MQDQWLLVHDHYLPILPVPYFQPIERGYMSEGSQEGVYVPPYVEPSEHTINIGGTDYHPDISETDKVSTYTGLDDYDTLFAARHGRGALDPVPRMSEQMIMTTSMGITPPTMSMGLMVNPLERVMPCPWYCTLKSERTGLPTKRIFAT